MLDSNFETPLESQAYTCLEDCKDCYQACYQSAMNHCLKTGGEHTSAAHFKLMMNCADICKMAVDFQLGQSEFTHRVCLLCAAICETCADSCEKLSGLEDCVLACLKCAESCRKMVSMSL